VVDIGVVSAPWTDWLRLVALPVFAWAADRDVRSRRVPNETWVPLALLAIVLLAADGWTAWTGAPSEWGRFVLPTAISLGLVVPLAYAFWYFGGFGGADAKALMVLALLFPVFPVFTYPPDLLPAGVTTTARIPPQRTPIGVFSFTILTNAVLAGIAYPLVVAGRNLAGGHVRGLTTFVGRPVAAADAVETHGRLLERRDGTTVRGLDLDALRMYLRWRDLSVADLRAAPARYRDPATLPAEPSDPTDGAVDAGDPGETRPDDAGAGDESDDGPESDPPYRPVYADPWGAEAFLADIEGTAYGTDPATLREGLETVAHAERVWITPGIPFVVPLFVGLVAAVLYGDVLYGLLGVLGIA